jgi:hypothetical protein
MRDWHTVGRPGYLGKRRDEQQARWDRNYGVGSWRLVWLIGPNYFEQAAALAVYEDAYFAFLSSYPDVLEQLVSEAADVYDDDLVNVGSRLDYSIQQTSRTHLQDIAIRRCLVRMGNWFGGHDLIQIRDSLGSHPLSLTLSPGRVPFHLPGLISQPQLEGWWLPGSVESFYQSNRFLQVRSE